MEYLGNMGIGDKGKTERAKTAVNKNLIHSMTYA